MLGSFEMFHPLLCREETKVLETPNTLFLYDFVVFSVAVEHKKKRSAGFG